MSSPNRQYKIMNTFTEDEVKYIQKKMKGYGCEIKYNSFNEINKKYLSRQTKQELYDTCEAQKKEIQKLKEENEKVKLQIKTKDNVISKISPQRTHWNNLIVERNKEIQKLKEDIKIYEGNCDFTSIEDMEEEIDRLKKENDKLMKVAEGKSKMYNSKLFDDNKSFIKDNEELTEGIKERDEYIEKVEDLFRSLDKIMEQQKKEIEDLKEVNEGITEQLEQYEEYVKETEAFSSNIHSKYVAGGEIQYIEDLEKLFQECNERNFTRNFCPFIRIIQKYEKDLFQQYDKDMEKKEVKKSIYEEKYNEMNDILSKYQ